VILEVAVVIKIIIALRYVTLHYVRCVCGIFQKKIKSAKKLPEGDKGQNASEGLSAETVVADEAFKLLQLVLRRAAATFRHIHCQSLWGNISSTVIGQVRDALARVYLCLSVSVSFIAVRQFSL